MIHVCRPNNHLWVLNLSLIKASEIKKIYIVKQPDATMNQLYFIVAGL